MGPRTRAGHAALFAVVVAVVTGPALLSPGTVVPGRATDDAHTTLWLASLLAGEPLLTGAALARALAGNAATVLGGAPFVTGLGAAGVLAWTVAVLAANAWAGAHLAGALGIAAGSRWPAALSLVLNPYVLGELGAGRPAQALLAPHALAAAALWNLRTRARAPRVAALLLLCAACWWYAGAVLSAGALALALLRRDVDHAEPAWPRVVPALVGLAAAALVFVARGDALVDDGPVRLVAGPAGIGPAHALLAALGLYRARSTRLAACLALTTLAAALPAADGAGWFQGRAAFAAHLALAPLVPAALAAFPSRGRALGGVALAIGVSAPLALAGLLPLGAWRASVPAGVHCLATAAPGAVLEIPTDGGPRALARQATHRQRLLRIGDAADPWIAHLDAIADGRFNRPPPDAGDAREAVRELGAAYVVAHVDADPLGLDDGSSRAWSRTRRALVQALGAPDHEDDTLAVWAMDGAFACP